MAGPEQLILFSIRSVWVFLYGKTDRLSTVIECVNKPLWQTEADMTIPSKDETKLGWRVPEWCAAVSISRALVYELIADDRISSVKLGAARIITTSPRDFLHSLAEEKQAA